MPPSREDRLRQYGETVLELGYPPSLEVGEAPSLEVDLRRGLTREELAAVRRRAPDGGPFTVVTAENPLGQVVEPERNAAATASLRSVLEEAGVAFVPCVGRAPDHSHREYGFAVGGPLEDALRLAHRFRQDAVFHFDVGRFLLVEVPGGRRHPLPLGVA